MSGLIFTVAAEYTQIARNDRHLLEPFESVVAFEKSMHNNHAVAQIHLSCRYRLAKLFFSVQDSHDETIVKGCKVLAKPFEQSDRRG